MITYFVFFFCKQKTAYEMRISDWSSDVCSSDLAAIGIYQAPGANAVAVAEQVTARMDELAQRFPEDIEYLTVYDTTVFVTSTIEAIIHTLLEAFLLVALVVFVRSEEHTSELQSLMRISYAVFCLKKKTQTQQK